MPRDTGFVQEAEGEEKIMGWYLTCDFCGEGLAGHGKDVRMS
jgi:hypothetical protein